MNVTELMAWHQREFDRLDRSGHTSFDIDNQDEIDTRAAVHWDAVQLLKWCIEVPSTFGGDAEGRDCAREMLAHAMVHAHAECVDDAQTEPTPEDIATAKKCARFFAQVSRNALEHNEDPPASLQIVWA